MYQLIMYCGDDGERIEYYSSREEAVFHLLHDRDQDYSGGVVLEAETW